MPRLRSSVPRPCSASVLADFYRQELLKHRDCLEQQREYYSDRAIADAEAGLMRLLAQLDQLCTKDDANELVAAILRKYDVVTGLSALSAMSEPGRLN
jgi:hypothetical protein